MENFDIAKIWSQCSPDLNRFISIRISDKSAAEDVLQDVFVKVHSQIDTLKNTRKLQGWIYRITRNTIIDYYRSKKPTVELSEDLEIPDSAAESGIIDELIPCVQRMVGRLPEKYRHAVILTEYQGLTQKEMGEKLGLSLSGAKSRAQRAREKLKDLLTDCCRFELDCRGTIIGYERKDETVNG